LSYITNYCYGLPRSTDCTPLSNSLTLGVGSIAIVVKIGTTPIALSFAFYSVTNVLLLHHLTMSQTSHNTSTMERFGNPS